MCLCILAYQILPQFPFLLAHNRDEFYSRGFESSHFWPPEDLILGGKDLKSGGMWLGINRKGLFATVTNFREPQTFKPNALSRGFLVKDFLAGEASPEAFIRQTHSKIPLLNPFSLLFGSVHSPWYYSSRHDQLLPLKPGLYVLSNHDLDTPWPKVQSARRMFSSRVQNSQEPLKENQVSENLFSLLEDRTRALPDQLPRTGLDLKIEEAVSSIFVDTPTYGTVCSTVVALNAEGKLSFEERTFENAKLKEERKFSLEMVPNP